MKILLKGIAALAVITIIRSFFVPLSKIMK